MGSYKKGQIHSEKRILYIGAEGVDARLFSIFMVGIEKMTLTIPQLNAEHPHPIDRTVNCGRNYQF